MATETGTASWGVTGSAGVTGIVTDIDSGSEPVLAPEYNELGQVVKQTHYDTVTTATATIEVAAGTNPPAAGTQITINGVTGYVKSARVVESNQAYRKISVTVEKYSKCSTASAVGTSGGGTGEQT